MEMFADDDDSLEEDLYAVLNLHRGATVDEIKAAFKRLSLIFHPDKHSDPEKRQEAVVLFEKIKNAHDILTDPMKKVLYDNYGMKALKNYGMELIAREKSVPEILAEYEAIRDIKEEIRMIEIIQPSTEFQMHWDASNLFKIPDNEEDPDSYNLMDVCPTLEKMKISQGINLLQTRNNTVHVTGEVSGSVGKEYDGNLGVSWRRLSNYFLKTWYDLAFIFYPGGRAVCEYSISRMLTDKIRGVIGINSNFALTNYSLSSAIGWRTGVHCFIANNIEGSVNVSSRSVDTMMNYTSQNGKHESKVIVGFSLESNYVNLKYSYLCSNDTTRLYSGVYFSTKETLFSYGATQKVSAFTRLTGKMLFGNSLGVQLFLIIKRGTHKYKLPVYLSDDINPIAIIYGTVVPLLLYLAVDRLIYQPWRKTLHKETEDAKSEKRAETLSQRAKEAKAAQVLMREKANRVRDQETVKNGLVILQAVYGKLCGGGDTDHSNSEELADSVDVTIPLQVMVENSKLILPSCASANERSNFEGFYDPCPNQEKVIYIRYLFHGKEHEMTAKDIDQVALPLEKHLVHS